MKPEVSKFPYTPKTGLNSDFDLPGGSMALLYQQAARNSTEDTNSTINGVRFAAYLRGGRHIFAPAYAPGKYVHLDYSRTPIRLQKSIT